MKRSNLLGDIGGLRTWLGQYGVTLGLQETAELWGNPSGGINQGPAFNGALLMSLGVDTQKAIGWDGGTFNVSAWQIHGRNFTADNLGVVQAASGVQATRATRLWEMWFQQSFYDGAADLKLGQQSLDMEFMTSTYSALFANAAFGWPALPANNMYVGGPAFPMSSLGARLRLQPTSAITFLGGVFNDNPNGRTFTDNSQVAGAAQSGTRFNMNTGALFIGELQYAINQPGNGDTDRGAGSKGLPGTYKIGGWYDSGTFPDQRYDDTGLSLADPASSGVARQHRGNWAVYGVIDQMVWRPSADSPQSVGVFFRATGGPGDRDLLNFSMDAGATMKAPIPGRDDDTVGIGVGLANFSSSAVDLTRDLAGGIGAYPIRGAETFLEITYQAVVTPWLTVQPDFQYFFTPSGGVPNPNSPGQRIGNEAVFGLRTNIVF
jgi:porin